MFSSSCESPHGPAEARYWVSNAPHHLWRGSHLTIQVFCCDCQCPCASPTPHTLVEGREAQSRNLLVVVGSKWLHLMEFIFSFTVNFDGLGWRWSSIIKAVLDYQFKLQDIEDWVNVMETVGKQNTNRIPTNVVDDLEGTDKSFGKSLQRTGGVNES